MTRGRLKPAQQGFAPLLGLAAAEAQLQGQFLPAPPLEPVALQQAFVLGAELFELGLQPLLRPLGAIA